MGRHGGRGTGVSGRRDLSLAAQKGQQSPASICPHPVGDQHLRAFPTLRPPYPQAHTVQKQVRPLVGERRLLKGFHQPVQIPAQLRDRLRAHHFARQHRYHPPHPPRRDAPPERPPGSASSLPRCAAESVPTPAAENSGGAPAQSATAASPSASRNRAGKIHCDTRAASSRLARNPRPPDTDPAPAPSAIAPRKTPSTPSASPGASLSPKTLLDLLLKMLKFLRPSEYPAHRGVSLLSRNWVLLAKAEPTYTLPFYTHNFTSPGNPPPEPLECGYPLNGATGGLGLRR